ncbi:MAG: hypothetical protein MZV49_23500 [Rhodopseudomonas palustris]|nr:hypothetical protein [Rhodopseudomonas palustris]
MPGTSTNFARTDEFGDEGLVVTIGNRVHGQDVRTEHERQLPVGRGELPDRQLLFASNDAIRTELDLHLLDAVLILVRV